MPVKWSSRLPESGRCRDGLWGASCDSLYAAHIGDIERRLPEQYTFFIAGELHNDASISSRLDGVHYSWRKSVGVRIGDAWEMLRTYHHEITHAHNSNFAPTRVKSERGKSALDEMLAYFVTGTPYDAIVDGVVSSMMLGAEMAHSTFKPLPSFIEKCADALDSLAGQYGWLVQSGLSAASAELTLSRRIASRFDSRDPLITFIDIGKKIPVKESVSLRDEIYGKMRDEFKTAA